LVNSVNVRDDELTKKSSASSSLFWSDKYKKKEIIRLLVYSNNKNIYASTKNFPSISMINEEMKGVVEN
jgi:hypothetical protein